MRWIEMILATFLCLCILALHSRLQLVEKQVEVLTDCCQRQELQLRRLEKERQATVTPETDQTAQIIQKYLGYFDDHDVSGLLED